MRHRMQKAVGGISAKIEGTVRDAHPKALSHMFVELTLKNTDAKEEDVRTAIQAAEEKLCPVWAMLKGNVEIKVQTVIEK